MTPPAPLSSRVAPIRSGATACTLRAKNLRRSRAPLGISDFSLGNGLQDNCSASTRPLILTLPRNTLPARFLSRPIYQHATVMPSSPANCRDLGGPREHVPTPAIEFRERAMREAVTAPRAGGLSPRALRILERDDFSSNR